MARRPRKTVRQPRVAETRIVSWVLAQLQDKYRAGLWERQNVIAADTGTRFVKAGTKGQADIRGLYKGIYFEFEAKRAGEVQSPDQIRRQYNITNAGGVYAVVRRPAEAFARVDNAVAARERSSS